MSNPSNVEPADDDPEGVLLADEGIDTELIDAATGGEVVGKCRSIEQRRCFEMLSHALPYGRQFCWVGSQLQSALDIAFGICRDTAFEASMSQNR